MSQIEINNKQDSPINEKLVKKTIRQVIKLLVEEGKLKKSDIVELSVAFVSRNEIKKLNTQYRKKDEPTDVLSFVYDDDGLNGELVLCYDIIKDNSLEVGISAQEELCKNIIHGMLHIIGHEHGEKMFQLQESILSRICQSDNKK